MNKIPVHIITGFLGSGKTTFLNHLIDERKNDRILVIENECGAINIDGALIMDGIEELVELSAGCLCCSLSEELIQVLYEASSKTDQFDRLVIETTGIADPSSIIQIFLQDTRVEAVFELKQVICLTDASLIEEWLNEAEEALRQIAMSDCILINKKDLVSPQTLKKVENITRRINPCAEVYVGSDGKFSISDIFSTGTINPQTVESVEKKEHIQHDHAHGEENQHRITTFSLTFPHPLNLDSLAIELDQIVNLYREQVYRVKGFIAIENYPNRVILQSARSAFVITDGTPWESEENRTGTLVFIGRDLKRKAFEKRFFRHMRNQVKSGNFEAPKPSLQHFP
jgi:G3E family GTPase